MLGLREMELNFGPQHPSTHGVLRLVLKVDGERIVSARPDIGYLHRGTEKLFETETYPMVVPHTDRLDYVAAATNNHAYCLAVEKLLGLELPKRAQYIRVLLDEMQRISSHVLWLATAAIDLGAITPFFYTFRDREVILDLFEDYCGARLTLNCMKIGGLPEDLPPGWVERVRDVRGAARGAVRRVRGPPDREPDLEAADDRRRHPHRRAVHRVGRHRAAAPWRRLQVGYPARDPVRVLPGARLRDPDLPERRHVRPVPRPDRRAPPEPPHRPPVLRLAPEEPRGGDPRQGAARHQAGRRRRLRGRRGAEGRARLLPRLERGEQALPPADPPAVASSTSRRFPRWRRGTSCRTSSRSSARSTSCWARSTADERRDPLQPRDPGREGRDRRRRDRDRRRHPDARRAAGPGAVPDPEGAEPGRMERRPPVGGGRRQAPLQGGRRPGSRREVHPLPRPRPR